MSKEDKTQFDSLKATEAIEFFRLLKNFQKRIKAELATKKHGRKL